MRLLFLLSFRAIASLTDIEFNGSNGNRKNRQHCVLILLSFDVVSSLEQLYKHDENVLQHFNKTEKTKKWYEM